MNIANIIILGLMIFCNLLGIIAIIIELKNIKKIKKEE